MKALTTKNSNKNHITEQKYFFPKYYSRTCLYTSKHSLLHRFFLEIVVVSISLSDENMKILEN